ncbi:unnamed protein product [Orchesella dallaii]|uniref:Uncharacterized protein n=1 Tax=Orchesella dallaii TaxID=48710 RepID=A0ABP1Q540_9HEXA
MPGGCSKKSKSSREGSRSKAKNRFTTGNNHHRHQARNHVLLMSLKLPYPPNLRQTTLLHQSPYNIQTRHNVVGLIVTTYFRKGVLKVITRMRLASSSEAIN